jgi:predicted DNA-binding transcriptional regulator AlpA
MNEEIAVLSGDGRSALSKNMDTLITLKEIGELLGVSRSSVYVLIKSPDFPKPYSLSARCQRWEKVEVEAWLLSRKGAAPEPRVKQSKASNVLTINGIDFIGASNGK